MLEKPEVQSCNFCELQKRISKIVRAGRPVTNFYGQKELENQKFQVVQTNQTIVFWYLDTVVCRVYFYSFNEPEIKELLKMAPQDAVLDILSRKPGEKVKWESVTGFPVYAVYGRVGHSIVGAKEERERFSHNPLDRFYREEYGRLAKKEQLAEIQKILRERFDRYADHLYSDEEMEELVVNNQVWIQCEDNQITTIFVYKIEGKKFYSNIAFNDSTDDVLYSIQKKVLLKAVEEYNITYYYGWIRINNRQALKKNHYPDFDAYDYVMCQRC